MEVTLLDALTVDTFGIRETEETLFEVAAVLASAACHKMQALLSTYSFSFQKAKAMFILP